jgi:DNA polymerase-3 subunit delta'
MDWDIIGQDWAAELLSEHIRRQEVRHAYLFSGPAGIGRRTLALRYAQALNCSQPPEPGQPCGECRICRQTAAMQQADLSLVQADASHTIKVDQIRELQHSLALSPYEAHYRVALLLNFEQATASSQNALLKTLEEPGERVILLLTADSPENLLPTITSRCEVMRLRPMSVEALAETLRTRRGVEGERAETLAHLAGGKPGTAFSLLQDPGQMSSQKELLDAMIGVLGESRLERFNLAEKLSKDKDQLRQTLLLWLVYWRDIMLSASGAAAPLTNLDRAEEIERIAGQVGFSAARERVAALEQAVEGLDANLNPRLLMDVVLMEMP